jgi:translation initiation factor 3 subunit C
MLLEVPYMAENVLETVRKPIARNFRRLLEIYDRQIFTGPPENPRECIMAATKALQKGDWKTCADHIMSLKFWDSFSDSENVKQVITERIKQEALNTYLLMYSSMYVSMGTKQLAEMFNLSKTTVHSLVSKVCFISASALFFFF